MPTLAACVRRTIQRHALLEPGARVLVALSGGADSVGLLHLLRELERDGFLTVAGLGHFNHQLRGTAADEDEQFCRDTGAALGIPVEVGSAPVRELAREQGRSVEDAARIARYAFLERAADAVHADVIAVGHTRDDQAETFLLRLLRGAGPRGLAGIRPRSGRVVRPLIEIGRAALREYVEQRRLAFREDATNADVAIPRNRVRHELIAYLQREFSPAIVDVLAREAAIARDDEDRLQREAIDLAPSVVLSESKPGEPVEVDADALTSLHPAIASRVARLALANLSDGRFVGYEHVIAFLDFVRDGAAGSELSLPGQQASHRGNRVVLKAAGLPRRSREAAAAGLSRRSREAATAGLSRRSREAAKAGNSFQVPLSIPGEVTLSRQGWAISAERLDGRPPGPLTARGDVVAVSATALNPPLTVRSRRPGDRFRPLGLGGAEKKLQDFLVDRKVPRDTRDDLPLVVDSDGRIVWVVGQAIGEDFRVPEPSRGVILLKVRRLGGEG